MALVKVTVFCEERMARITGSAANTIIEQTDRQTDRQSLLKSTIWLS
jgi:hypothetical protein